MRIAVWHNLPSGGGKRALYEHVRGLAARGHTLEAFCPASADTGYLPLTDLISETVLPFAWKDDAPPGRIGRLLHIYRRLPAQIAAMDAHCREAAARINAGGYDLLFANSCQFLAAAPIAKYVTIPTVLYLGEPYRALYEARPTLPWLALPFTREAVPLPYGAQLIGHLRASQARLQAREERENAFAFGTILTNSHYSRESILRAYGRDSQVCYLGIDTELFTPNFAPDREVSGSRISDYGSSSGTEAEGAHEIGVVRGDAADELWHEPYVVGLGSITSGKGIDRAIRAMATIDATCRPELVWIANMADPRYLPEVERLAAECGVRFVPRMNLSDSDVVQTLGNAALMLYTPLLEPFGFAPLEANACGVPVVGIAEGGVRETIIDGVNGIHVGDADPHTLGAAVLAMLKQPDMARAMGRAARRHVIENWTWKHAIDRLDARLREARMSAAKEQAIYDEAVRRTLGEN